MVTILKEVKSVLRSGTEYTISQMRYLALASIPVFCFRADMINRCLGVSARPNRRGCSRSPLLLAVARFGRSPIYNLNLHQPLVFGDELILICVLQCRLGFGGSVNDRQCRRKRRAWLNCRLKLSVNVSKKRRVGRIQQQVYMYYRGLDSFVFRMITYIPGTRHVTCLARYTPNGHSTLTCPPYASYSNYSQSVFNLKPYAEAERSLSPAACVRNLQQNTTANVFRREVKSHNKATST